MFSNSTDFTFDLPWTQMMDLELHGGAYCLVVESDP